MGGIFNIMKISLCLEFGPSERSGFSLTGTQNDLWGDANSGAAFLFFLLDRIEISGANVKNEFVGARDLAGSKERPKKRNSLYF